MSRSSGLRARLVAALLVVAIAAGCGSSSPTPTPLRSPSSSPTTEVTAAASSSLASPTETAEDGAQTVPVFVVPDKLSDENLRRMTERTPLSATDAAIRQWLIVTLRWRLGVGAPQPVEGDIYRSFMVRIEYVSEPDDFEGEILAGWTAWDLNAAKLQAEMWLRMQGLSDFGICHLPLTFYPSGDLRDAFRDAFPDGVPWDPNPVACHFEDP
jgi:hypothetical protein